MHNKVREWIVKYGPSEVVGTIAAIGAAWLTLHLTGHYALSAIVGTIAENVGYYAVIMTRKMDDYYRKHFFYYGDRHIGRVRLRAFGSILVEFGPAEIVDNLVVRPGLYYYIPSSFGGAYALKIFIAKVCADIVFYVVAIALYEIRTKLFPGKPEKSAAEAPEPKVEPKVQVADHIGVIVQPHSAVAGGQGQPPVSLAVPSSPAVATAEEQRQTPYLLVDMQNVQAKYYEFRQVLPDCEVHYAMKCNPDRRILEAIHAMGGSFEIASYAELEALIEVGVNPSEVIFSNPVKVPAHIRRCYKAGLNRFAFDSVSELEKLAANAPGASVYVRLATVPAGSVVASEGKFGVDAGSAVQLMRGAKALGLQPYGVSFHVGSQMTDVNAWKAALAQCAQLMTKLEAHAIRLEMVDMGGGFPARYDEDVPPLTAIADAINEGLQLLPYRPSKIIVEPGRGLVAESGMMVASVIGVGRRAGRDWVHLDVGAFNGLMEALETGTRLHFPIRDSRGSVAKKPYVVTGPSCDSQDTIEHAVPLSADLSTGDLVYIESAGAYSTCYASNFNGFAAPQTFIL